MNSDKKSLIIRSLFSLTFIGLIIYFLRGEIIEGIHILKTDVNWLFFLAGILVFLVCLGVLALRLQTLFKVQGVFLKFMESFYLGFVGLYYNLFLPSAVGGDIVKVYYAYKHSGKKLESITTVFFDRLLGFGAVVGISFCASWFLRHSLENSAVKYSVWFVAFAFFCITIVVLSKPIFNIVKFMVSWLPFKKVLHKLDEAFETTQLYIRDKLSLAKGLGLSFLGQTLIVVSYYLLARSLTSDISFLKCFLLVPVVIVVSMAPSIGGLGVREAGLIFLFKNEIGPERAVALSILVDLMVYGYSFVGGVWYTFQGKLEKKKEGDVFEHGPMQV